MKWNGSAWSTLGTGINNSVGALDMSSNGQLHVGAGFTTVGDGSKVSVYFGIYRPTAATGTAGAARALPLGLYPNPARSSATVLLPLAPQGRWVRITDGLRSVAAAVARPRWRAHARPARAGRRQLLRCPRQADGAVAAYSSCYARYGQPGTNGRQLLKKGCSEQGLRLRSCLS